MRTLTYTTTEADAGRQIRRIIRGSMGISAHQLARAKAQGEVRLNGQPARADQTVAPNQTVSLTLFDDEPILPVPMENAPVAICYEDDDLLILDKPAPLPTQSSPRQTDHTLENRLAYYFRDAQSYIFRPVNRLDKGTSGLMAVAKHAHAQARLSAQLHTPDFVREYLAVTDGIPSPNAGIIDRPIGKADGATVRREIRADGKACRTHYETLETNGALALVRLRLETGRTHQIRVHLKSIGCPVYGDFLYGTEQTQTLPERFALHSAYLRFQHPLTGETLAFASPLPQALQNLLARAQTP